MLKTKSFTTNCSCAFTCNGTTRGWYHWGECFHISVSLVFHVWRLSELVTWSCLFWICLGLSRNSTMYKFIILFYTRKLTTNTSNSKHQATIFRLCLVQWNFLCATPAGVATRLPCMLSHDHNNMNILCYISLWHATLGRATLSAELLALEELEECLIWSFPSNSCSRPQACPWIFGRECCWMQYCLFVCWAEGRFNLHWLPHFELLAALLQRDLL